MVRKKPQSKRVLLKDKWKQRRKVTEHNRKLRRLAKKNPGVLRSARNKDPGIPNLHPYKEALVAKLDRQRQMLKESQRLQSRRANEFARRRREAERKGIPLEELSDEEGMDEAGSAALAAMASRAAQAGRAFDAQQAEQAEELAAQSLRTALKAGEQNRRAFYKHLRKVVDRADVILEVLDARDPMGCRAPEVERFILERDSSKRIVLVLNKIDLVPPAVVRQWIQYLRGEFPCIAFKASTQRQRTGISAATDAHIGKALKEGTSAAGAGAAGVEGLMGLIKNYSRKADTKTAITVGIIGYPNVGKSSIINSLKRQKAVQVSSTPGSTKAMQEVQLETKVKLLDCPGIIFDDGAGGAGPKDGGAGLLLRNCVTVESMEEPEMVVAGILKRCNPAKLQALYNLPRFEGFEEFLERMADKFNKKRKGGMLDTRAAAVLVLQQWNAGKIPFFTVPPRKRNQAPAAGSVRIVGDDGQAVDMTPAFTAGQDAVLARMPQHAERDFVGMADSGFATGGGAAVARALGGDDEDDDAMGAPAAGAEAAFGVDLERVEEQRRRKAARESRPVRAALDAEDLAANPMDGAEQRKAEKAARKQRRRAERGEGRRVHWDPEVAPAAGQAAADDEEAGEENDVAVAQPAKAGAGGSSKPAGGAYDFDEFF